MASERGHELPSDEKIDLVDWDSFDDASLEYLPPCEDFIEKSTRPHCCLEAGCGYAATQASHLKTHMLTHRPTKALQCPVPGCGYATNRREHLTRHAKRHSRGAAASGESKLAVIGGAQSSIPPEESPEELVQIIYERNPWTSWEAEESILHLADDFLDDLSQFGAELDGMGIGYPLSDEDTAMGSGSDFENAGSDPPTSPATSPLIGMWSAWRPTTVAGSKRLQQAVESIKGEAHSCPWPGCTFVTAHKV